MEYPSQHDQRHDHVGIPEGQHIKIFRPERRQHSCAGKNDSDQDQKIRQDAGMRDSRPGKKQRDQKYADRHHESARHASHQQTQNHL